MGMIGGGRGVVALVCEDVCACVYIICGFAKCDRFLMVLLFIMV